VEYLKIKLKQEALKHGELQIIPIKRLQSLKTEFDDFKKNEALNGFQKWIVNDLYKFALPTVGFTMRSIYSYCYFASVICKCKSRVMRKVKRPKKLPVR
jgi:hypothetical protein